MKATGRLAGGMALVLLAAAVSPDAALGGPVLETRATYDGDVIRIKTFVEIYGPQATEALAAVIEGEINTVWQDPANQQSFCGVPVEFEAEVRVRQGAGTEGWHQIKIQRLRRGRTFRDFVDGSDPYGGDIGGAWSPFNDEEADRYHRTVYAHEAGHLFGAPDEYIEPGWFRRGGPLPGREATLMADDVPWVDSYTVNNILQSAFPDGDQDLPRCIQGSVHEKVTIEEGPHRRTGFSSLTINLETSSEGELRGHATGEFTLAGTYEQGDCGFGYSTRADIDLDIVATGEGNGPYKIESELPILIDEVQRHMLCDTPVDLVIDWEVTLELEDVLFGELDLGNGNVMERQYRLEEETPRKLQVHLWMNGVEGD